MSAKKQYYYHVALIGTAAPIFTYASIRDIVPGSIVTIPLKSRYKQAVILTQTTPPAFETSAICSVSQRYYTPEQMQIAKFISTYYFSSFSEAIALFLPYRRGTLHGYPLDTQDIRSNTKQPGNQGQPQGIAPTLSSMQQKAYEQLLHLERALLFGVTGSGKTEIFITLMAKMLEEGKTSIFLMPEISLTPQMEKRLRSYFGDTVAIWHSKITKKRKEQILERIAAGEVRIIAGARSALFTPLPDLGLIVVDEEHDDSYKAHTRPRYHARDVALLMGQKLGAKVLLASATPSPSSYHKYEVVRLSKPYTEGSKRYRFVTGDTITQTMLDALESNFAAGAQSLLFLPTRGNFKYLYCQQCGQTHLCPYCSVGMALHRNHRHLKCHYCNYTEAIRDTCAQCGHTPLRSERIGTQEAIEIITRHIKGIQIEQFDKDSITTAKKLKEALQRFESGQSHLLLGTQMLSKGHDYAAITLSIIMGLDHISGLADYRARERAMGLFFQIAGRSGRSGAAEVIIQTNDPEFYRAYLGDYERFLQDELLFLEHGGYPPFVSLARILIAHKDQAKASKITLDTVTKLRAFTEIEIVGSGKAPIEKIANKFRFHILLRSKHRAPLLKALHHINRREIEIDMDPVEFA